MINVRKNPHSHWVPPQCCLASQSVEISQELNFTIFSCFPSGDNGRISTRSDVKAEDILRQEKEGLTEIKTKVNIGTAYTWKDVGENGLKIEKAQVASGWTGKQMNFSLKLVAKEPLNA